MSEQSNKELVSALKELIEAIQYTPLGLTALHALRRARRVLEGRTWDEESAMNMKLTKVTRNEFVKLVDPTGRNIQTWVHDGQRLTVVQYVEDGQLIAAQYLGYNGLGYLVEATYYEYKESDVDQS